MARRRCIIARGTPSAGSSCPSRRAPRPASASAPSLKRHFEARLLPLGFDFDPNVLIYASNAGRDTFGVYGFDLKTRQRTTLSLEHPHRDLVPLDAFAPWPELVFDKFRRSFAGVHADGPTAISIWLDRELAGLQQALEEKFPQRRVRILEWNEARTRLLVRVVGGTDPGRIYLYRRREDQLVELMRATPWLPAAELHATQFVEFAGPGGTQLSGFLTLPHAPRLDPPPVVIWFAPGLPPRPHPEFDPQAQVLADMGFVVCRLNNRGVLGLGARHRDALRRDLDHAAADDALAAIEWIAQRHRIDRKRVVAFGEGFAGHLAVRATQVRPGAFRCAVAFDPILNLTAWVQPPPDSDAPPTAAQQINRLYLEGGGARLHQIAAGAHAEQLNAPLFIAAPAVPRTAAETTLAAGVANLRAQLKRRDIPSVVVDYHEDFTARQPAARARVYRQLEEFLHLNLYQYNVKVGPTRVVK